MTPDSTSTNGPMTQDTENRNVAWEGLRHLAASATDERIRFRACEYLLGIPRIVYADGLVDPADLPPTAVPVCGASPQDVVLQMQGADIG